jgi:hypothetical protein
VNRLEFWRGVAKLAAIAIVFHLIVAALLALAGAIK